MSCSLQLKRSPLHVPAEKGHTDVVDILVTHGANVDSVRKSAHQHTKDKRNGGHLVNICTVFANIGEGTCPLLHLCI